ncbi:MAG: ATP-binding protein [Bacteroidales bacterium]|nr:ATP-binding protein [Bacteroidales bacterium]
MPELPKEILNHLLDNSDSMISIIDDEMRYVTVNEPFCRSFNMQRNELVGKCPAELWGEDIYREKIRNNIEKSLGGETVRYRAYFDISGSAGRYYDVTYRPFKSPGTNISYAIIETKGVKFEKEISGKNIDLDRKYEYMEKYLPFGIFSCSRGGMILEANETFYTILEAGAYDMEGLNFNDLLRFDPRFSDFLNSGIAGETSSFSQMQMLTSQGREIFVRISSHIREDENYGIVADGMLEDVTREVQLERRLQQSQRLETLGTLAGGVAHDFNTILNTISGYAEMTMDEVDRSSAVYEYMIRLRSALNKAVGIINQMMVFSKQMDQHLVALEIDRIIREAVEFIRLSLPHNVKLKTKYRKIEGHIHADPIQLFRVFLNIMTNALQAMEDEGGIMSVSLSESKADARSFAVISIADTGTGIDPSIIDRIFEPFFTTKEANKGTGMGLAVSHGIISGTGGEITVESKPGEGSVFTLRIPLREMDSEPLTKYDEHTGNILFAHDNLQLSRTVSMALGQMGYNVILSHSQNDIEDLINHRLSDRDTLFIVNKFAHQAILDFLERKQNEGMSFRLCLIKDRDAGPDPTGPHAHYRNFALIKEPLTLKDILSHIY